MRDPYRLNRFYDELSNIHIKFCPDWRFGQLCSNFFGWLNYSNIDPFYIEEDEMILYLKRYAGTLISLSCEEENLDLGEKE
jgi:hypothetical protein